MAEINIQAANKKDLIEKLSHILTPMEAGAVLSKVHKTQTQVGAGKRFGIYPIEDWEAYERMKNLEAAKWPASEVKFNDDIESFNELTEEEKRPLLMAFGFFAVGDGTITSMLAYRMLTIAPTLEKQLFYIVQMDNERVHAETYSNMIYTLVPDEEKRIEILTAVENIQTIKKMNEMIEESLEALDGEREMYFLLASTEYIMFTPLFCVIFWYRAYHKEKIHGVIFSNELIAKDEASHCINGTENYRSLPAHLRYTNEEIWVKMDAFVERVSDFAREMLENVNLPELTVENVIQYTKYVADDQLKRMGHKKYYNVDSPFLWMNFTKLVNKTNFYEGTVGEYKRYDVREDLEQARKFSGLDTKVVSVVQKKERRKKF